MGLIKELASLPTVTLSDGQDYVQMYDVLETVKRWKLSETKRKKKEWIRSIDSSTRPLTLWFECPECHKKTDTPYDYCPYCGEKI